MDLVPLARTGVASHGGSPRPWRLRSTALGLLVLGLASALVGAECAGPVSVAVEVRDAVSGQLVPAKLSVFDATTDTPVHPKPTSAGDRFDLFQENAYLGAGAATLDLDPGSYRVYASRGITHTVDERVIVVDDATGLETFTVERVVSTPGYLSADLHVHTIASFDNSPGGGIPLPERVLSYMVEGVEIIASSDHDCIVDLAPAIAALGVGASITSVVGVEATPGLDIGPPDAAGNCWDWGIGNILSEHGHWNAMPVSPAEIFDGSSDEGVSAANIYDRMRALGSPPPFIQLNHPYLALDDGRGDIGWFSQKWEAFEPTVPIPPFFQPGDVNAFLRERSTEPGSTTESIDFDAMEIVPGGFFRFYRPSRLAWFSLLDQGFLKVATANSDSHKYKHKTAGMPRNLLGVGAETPATLTPQDVAAAVTSGRVIGTTGPVPMLSIAGHGLGELVTDTDGSVTLDVSVQAAPWVPVQEVRVVANGAVVLAVALTPQSPEPVLRYQAALPLTVTEDTWVIVEAGAFLPADPLAEPPAPPVYAHVTTGFAPLSFTNPIFIDRDGNGAFDAPGL